MQTTLIPLIETPPVGAKLTPIVDGPGRPCDCCGRWVAFDPANRLQRPGEVYVFDQEGCRVVRRIPTVGVYHFGFCLGRVVGALPKQILGALPAAGRA